LAYIIKATPLLDQCSLLLFIGTLILHIKLTDSPFDVNTPFLYEVL